MTSGDALDQMLMRLRARGLTYTSLAIVAEEIYGWRLPANTIRRRLRTLGVQPDKTRARYGQANALIGARQQERAR